MSKPLIQQNKSNDFVLWVALSIPVIWLAAVLAQIPAGTKLPLLLDSLSHSLHNPFDLTWTDRTAAFIIAAVLLYGLCVAMYYTTQSNKRPGQEYGSAAWGDPKRINAKYADRKNPSNNIILTQNVSIGFDGHKHRRNLNIFCVGGSGAGKSRYFCAPGLMNAPDDCSFIVCDPKAELLRNVGPVLEAKGYEITVFDLMNVDQSDCFNPLLYLRDDRDVFRLVNNIIRNTTKSGSKSDDPFWEKSETALLSALILLLLNEAPVYERTFGMVMYLIENAATSEDNEDYKSPVDIVMDALEEEQPDHIAVRQYRVFKQASGKTAKSILVSAAVRLQIFTLPSMQRLTNKCDMDFATLATKKRAIFAIVPDSDTSINYLVGLLYSTATQELYYAADYKYGGSLPRHVRFVMDEFPNVQMPDADFERFLATARGRNLSYTIICQNMSQIRSMFEKSWENITGCTDVFLYLGGNEQFTHEYISKLLGKQNLEIKTHGISRGRSGSSSENTQHTGRELLMPDEVRMIDNDYALLFIRGELPIIDRKYDLMRHPNIKLSAFGGAKPYQRPISYSQPDLSAPFTELADYIFDSDEITNPKQS